MGKLIIAAAPLDYSGTKGSGPVLPEGKQIVHVAEVRLTDDSVSNPFSDGANAVEKVRGYDDCREVIAVRVSNKLGGLTERFHFDGFVKYAELSEAQKAEKNSTGKDLRYSEDMESGYAIEDYLENGKRVPTETGELKDGKPVMRALKTRVVDEAKSAVAKRILSDFMVACRIAKTDGMTTQQIADAIGTCTQSIGITVVTETYLDKTRSKMTSPTIVTTSVATGAAAVVEAVEEADEF